MGKIFTNLKEKNIKDVYKFKEKLGKGSFAVVWRGINIDTGEEVAIKNVEKRTLSKEELETLNEEVDILKKIDHVHIVKLYDIYETRDSLYMVMELLRGGEVFDSIIKKGTYSEKEAATVMRQVVQGVKYLHDHGITHRDLKPENIIYEKDPYKNPGALVKITDLGLAKYLGNDESSGMMKTACGTPGYVAPEILKGLKYTESIDVWSLGVILYILLCGYPPFSDENTSLLYSKIRHGSYTFGSPWWDEISSEAMQLISRMLTVNPVDRISTYDVLRNPWFKKMEKSKRKTFKKQYTENLLKFQARRKLRAGMTAVFATSRFKSAILKKTPIHKPVAIKEEEPEEVPVECVSEPKKTETAEPLKLTITIAGKKKEFFKLQACTSWTVARLKQAISVLLKTDPHRFSLSFKRTTLRDRQELRQIPSLQSGSKISCSRLQHEEDK